MAFDSFRKMDFNLNKLYHINWTLAIFGFQASLTHCKLLILLS